MTWLTPWLGGIAAAIAVPTLVILYFLKLRRRDLEISTTLLWKKAIQDLQANAPFQRLRRNILLILQLFVLAGILFALGQPQIKGQTISGTKHVILIDRSGSMTALDADDGKGGKQSRLDAAKEEASVLIDSLREGGVLSKESADEAMVIAFDTTAEVRQQFTADKNVLKAAIAGITPVEGPTAVEEAMRLAKAHKPRRIVEDVAVEGLSGGLPVTMHLYSDGKLPDADKAVPSPEDTVEFHLMGDQKTTNVGVVGVRSERNYDNPLKLSVFVALENTDTTARIVDVEILIDGVVAGIKNTTVGAATSDGPRLSATESARAAARENEAAAAVGASPDAVSAAALQTTTPGVGGVVFALDRGEGALVQVRLREPGTGEPLSNDVFALDDRAWLWVPPAKKMAVAVVTRGNLFIASALSGLPLSRLTELRPEQFDELLRQGKLGEYDVVLLDGHLPQIKVTPPPAADAAAGAPPPAAINVAGLPPGRFLVFGAVPGGPSGIIDKGVGDGAAMVHWSRDHPVLRSLSLDTLIIGEVRKVETVTGGPAVVIGTSDEGPAILEVATAETRAIVVPFDVAKSSWPFDVSFVVFLGASINYLGDDASSGSLGRLVQPGSVLSDRLPAGAADVHVKTPGGETQKLTPAADGRVVFGPLAKSGVYEVTWTGPRGPTDVEATGGRVLRFFAANLLDAAESDVGAATQVALASKVVAAQSGGAAEADRKLWPWLLLAALMVIMLEWFVYNRKVQI